MRARCSDWQGANLLFYDEQIVAYQFFFDFNADHKLKWLGEQYQSGACWSRRCTWSDKKNAGRSPVNLSGMFRVATVRFTSCWHEAIRFSLFAAARDLPIHGAVSDPAGCMLWTGTVSRGIGLRGVRARDGAQREEQAHGADVAPLWIS